MYFKSMSRNKGPRHYRSDDDGNDTEYESDITTEKPVVRRRREKSLEHANVEVETGPKETFKTMD